MYALRPMPVLLDFERKRQPERDGRRFNMKIVLGSLAAILLAGGIVIFLSNTTAPLARMRLSKEAVNKAIDRPDGYRIASETIRDAGGSRIALPQRSPNAFDSVKVSVANAVAKVKSWFGNESVSLPAQESPKQAAGVAPPRTDPSVVTITRDVSVHIEYGIVGLRRGTRVAFLSRDGANVHVRDATGETLVVPTSATDLH